MIHLLKETNDVMLFPSRSCIDKQQLF